RVVVDVVVGFVLALEAVRRHRFLVHLPGLARFHRLVEDVVVRVGTGGRPGGVEEDRRAVAFGTEVTGGGGGGLRRRRVRDVVVVDGGPAACLQAVVVRRFRVAGDFVVGLVLHEEHDHVFDPRRRSGEADARRLRVDRRLVGRGGALRGGGP